jgi:endonuclease-3 related protein
MNQKSNCKTEILKESYEILLEKWGCQGWWPANSVEEMIIGAILTQNTAWRNVELAIANLNQANLMSFKSIIQTPAKKIASIIRPAGYFNIKALRLKAAAKFFVDYKGGDFNCIQDESHNDLREALLDVYGIGNETADAILLYGFNKPAFVIDAYTMRFIKRHGLIEDDGDYLQAQKLFTQSIPADVKIYNEFHALLVKLGKEHCRTTANCEDCPLNRESLFSTKNKNL